MMEQAFALLMSFLEMIFLFVVLAALCHQRSRIGKSAFVMACILIFLFDHILVAANLRVALWGNKSFLLGEASFYLPVLAAFLMVYILFGTLHTQQLLIGVVIGFLLTICFWHLTVMQCSWHGFSIVPGIAGEALTKLMTGATPTVNAIAASHLLDMLFLPMCYSRAIRSMPRRAAVPLSLFGAQLIGFFPFLVAGAIRNAWGYVFDGTFFAKIIATAILSLALLAYLELLESEVSQPQTGALDFLFAFFGSYGKVQELQQVLQEWENRFHMILRHSADAIIVTDETGNILEANRAAARLLTGKDSATLTGTMLFSRFEITEPEKRQWRRALTAPLFFQGKVETGDEKDERIFTASLAPIPLRKQRLLVLIAKDVTQEVRLAAEKASLTEQLNHSQRLESLGMLAGGVAHDFNNYIHAILGHVDVATLIEKDDPEAVQKHIEIIGSIAEKAGKLTAQLLGFARKGKYHVVPLDVPTLFQESCDLLGPGERQGIALSLQIPRGRWSVAADSQQMHQVLLNLMLNAIYAMEHDPEGADKKKEMILSVGEAADAPMTPVPPPDHPELLPEKYLFLAVSDNGCGMDEKTKKRLFEPFFTTKPTGVGTGMGLAMIYGIITHHNGWIQCESAPGKGTVFYLFLPKAETNEEIKTK